MRISVIGAGYVGLVTGVGLAQLGHRVAIGEADPMRVSLLRNGRVPFHEPDVDHRLQSCLADGTLTVHEDNAEAVAGAAVVFIAVPTPAGADGEADMTSVDRVVDDLLPAIRPGTVVVLKSTVPAGTTHRLHDRFAAGGVAAHVVANPEFLRAGSAMADFLSPSRVVIGADDPTAAHKVARLYDGIDTDVVVTDPLSAELIKYGSNAYLAARVSFVNEMANLCEAVGADAETVLAGMGGDPRIGSSFLQPGPGFGGSCLPKDSNALLRMAALAGIEFRSVDAALDVNEAQRARNLERVVAGLPEPAAGCTVAMWGLAFKAGTDDVRESPAMWLVEDLAALGIAVQAYDELAVPVDGRVRRAADPVEACRAADVLVIATESAAFRRVDLGAVAAVMQGTTVVDLRNVLEAGDVTAAGLTYVGLRRSGPAARVEAA